MANETFEDLLSRMPEIAKAVNSFTSEEIQKQAFDALVRAAGAAVGPAGRERQDQPPTAANAGDSGTKPRKRAAKPVVKSAGSKQRKASNLSPSMVGDLDLRPVGKRSFKEFVAEKAPKSTDDKNVVAVYYLKHELGIGQVGVDHVFTCYREMKESWKIPTNFRNALQITASRHGYIATKDMDDIVLNAAGTNRVEHDLPTKP